MSHQTSNHINLQEPTPADVSKLHSEINQYINQRLTVITTAITVFGIFTGWIVTRNDNQGQLFQIATALIILLTLLFLYYQVIVWHTRTLASYLRVTGQSPWEVAHRKHKNKYNKEHFYILSTGQKL
ncbi:MAG: hypothetical protein GC158_04720 [Cyanobacteria bacterium RI_101]|nr:hypothetical protein [Cyanobacteria bacterium RI_101]